MVDFVKKCQAHIGQLAGLLKMTRSVIVQQRDEINTKEASLEKLKDEQTNAASHYNSLYRLYWDVVANNQVLMSSQVQQDEEAKRWQERWNNVLQMNDGLLESNRKLGEQIKEADNKLVEQVKLWEEEYEEMRALLEKMFDLHQIATENEE